MLDKLRDFLQWSNNIASLLLKILVIAVIALSVSWVGFSFYANRQIENQQNQQVTPIPPFPDKKLAKHLVILKNTGETLLSNNITGSGSIHVLNGYYEMGNSNRKWIYHNAVLRIDEKYMPVQIVAR